MKNWRNRLPKSKKTYFFFMLLFCFLIVNQFHFHSHHGEHEHHAEYAGAHVDAINLHNSFDDSHFLHHSDAKVVDLQPGTFLKKLNNDILDIPVFILLALLMLSPLFKRQRFISVRLFKKLKQSRFLNLPLLRAPPAPTS